PDPPRHLGAVDPAPVHRVGDLVEDDQLVVAALEHPPGRRPGAHRPGPGRLQVVGVPGEAVAERVPVDPEAAADLLLPGPPAARLEELDDADLPAAGRPPPAPP